MGKLRDEMLMEMELRNFSPKTIKAYTWHMVAFTKLFSKSPAELGEEQIRKYLHYLKTEKKASWSNINIGYSALKFFYVNTLHREWNLDKLPRPRGESKLPVVLSQREVDAIFNTLTNVKHRLFLMTTYCAGLRISETAHLKPTDIDSGRMQIRVEQGKGKKDRYTLLSETLLKDLRSYYKRYRPTIWLFPGQQLSKPLAPSTMQRVFKRAKKKPVSLNQPRSIPCATALPPIS